MFKGSIKLEEKGACSYRNPLPQDKRSGSHASALHSLYTTMLVALHIHQKKGFQCIFFSLTIWLMVSLPSLFNCTKRKQETIYHW